MASEKELMDFFIGAERRAFKQAIFAVQDGDTALDIVQDAMIRLAEKYSDKTVNDLAPLFQRILQNVVHDHFRRQKVRNAKITLFSQFTSKGEENDYDLLDTLQVEKGSLHCESTEECILREETLTLIEQEIQKLPLRQREAFLMRYWEDMNVAETALAMGCSQGSVKTHCSRAAHTLAKALRAKGIIL